MRIMKWLIRDFIFGFGASAGNDAYRSVKKAVTKTESTQKSVTDEGNNLNKNQ